MTKFILGVGALLAAAVVLAGCGGGSTNTATTGTSGGVAGTSHTQTSASFSAKVHGLEGRMQTSVNAFESGNLSKAIASGGPILNNCMGLVNTNIAPHASTHAQMDALAHLRSACGEMTQAANAGASGSTMKAKQFARAALGQARIAARLSG